MEKYKFKMRKMIQRFIPKESEPYKVLEFGGYDDKSVIVTEEYNEVILSVSAEKFDEFIKYLDENEIKYTIDKSYGRYATRKVEIDKFDQVLTSKGVYVTSMRNGSCRERIFRVEYYELDQSSRTKLRR